MLAATDAMNWPLPRIGATEHEISGEPRLNGTSGISPVTRPVVVGYSTDHPGFHRIQMNVAHDFEQVGIHVDQRRVVAALEQMPGGWQLELESSRVVGRDVAHDGAERCRRDAHAKVKMVGHPAIRVDLSRMPLDRALDDRVEQCPIAIFAEDVLLMIASQGYVIEPAGEMDTWGPSQANTPELSRPSIRRWISREKLSEWREWRDSADHSFPHFPHPAPA
jgi:hypothetical protein